MGNGGQQGGPVVGCVCVCVAMRLQRLRRQIFHLQNLLCCDINPFHPADLHKNCSTPWGNQSWRVVPQTGLERSMPGQERSPACLLRDGQPPRRLWSAGGARAPDGNRGNQNPLCSEGPSSRESADIWQGLRCNQGCTGLLLHNFQRSREPQTPSGLQQLGARGPKEGNQGLNLSWAT